MNINVYDTHITIFLCKDTFELSHKPVTSIPLLNENCFCVNISLLNIIGCF